MNIKAFCMLALLVCSGEAFAELSYYPTWIDDSGIHYTPGNEVVMKDEAAAGWNSGARSSEVLLAADDGWIRYEVESYQSATRAFGFAITDPNYHYTSMAYSFRLANSTCYFQKGSVIVGAMAVTQGDVLEIVKNGTDIEYKVNGVTRVTTTPAQFSDMFLDLAFHTRWGYIGKLEVSFGNDYDSEWEEVIGISKTAATLTKTAADGWGNAGASSDNVLKPNEAGWISYTPPNTTGHLAFGFSDLDKDQHYSSIDYCMLVDASGMLKGYSNGSLLFAGSYAAGDVLTITRQDNEYIFTQNTTVLHTANDYSRVPMIGDLAIYRNNTVLNQSDFRLSFDQEVYSYVEVTPLDYGQNGLAVIQSYGANKNKKVNWNEDFMTSSEWTTYYNALDSVSQSYYAGMSYEEIVLSDSNSKSFVSAGEYTVNTADSLGNFARLKVPVGYALETDSIWGMTYANQNITKTASSTYAANADFALENGLYSGLTEGFVEFQALMGLQTEVKFGVREYGDSPQSFGNQIKYGFSVSNGSLKIIDNGSLGSFNGKIFGNEVFRLEFTTDSVFYYKDEKLIDSKNLVQNKHYQVDTYINKQGDVIKITGIKFDKPHKPITPSTIKVSNLQCNQSTLGSIFIDIPYQLVGCMYTFFLRDADNNVVASNNLGVFNDLNVGQYTVEVVPPQGCFFTTSWAYSVDVGYVVDWDQLLAQATVDVDANAYGSNLYNGSGNGDGSEGFSSNTLYLGNDGWVEFRPGPLKDNRGDIRLIDGNGEAIALFWYNNATPSCSFRLFNDPDLDYVYFQESFDVLRIERKDGQYIAHFNDQTYPFSWGEFPTVTIQGYVAHDEGRLNLCRASFGCPTPFVQYAQLHKTVESPVYIPNDGNVYFTYFNDYHSLNQTLNFNVFDENYNEVAVDMNLNQNMTTASYGKNKYALNLSSLTAGEGNIYFIEVINDKNEREYLRFEYLP